MNPQKRINELFLEDVLLRMRTKECDAVDCFTRLRLYAAVVGYRDSLRGLLKDKGFSLCEYDALLKAYNEALAHRDPQ